MKKLIGAIAVVLTLALSTLAMAGCTKPIKVKVIDVNLTAEEYAFVVNKNDANTLAKANELIAELKASGKIAELIEKYTNGAADTRLFYENPTKTADMDTQFVMSTSPDFPPFEAKEGNKFVGIDIEIAKMLADKIGKPLFVKETVFDSILLEVSGTVPNANVQMAHIGMAGLTVTAIRKETVTFTDPYFADFSSTQVIIAKEGDTTFDACTTKEQVYDILKSFTTKTKIGYQRGTTGEFLTNNTYFEDKTILPLNVTGLPFEKGPLAVLKLQQQELDYVIIDKLPAKEIAEEMNKNIK